MNKILARNSHSEPQEAITEKSIHRSENLTKNSISLKLVKKPACQILPKTFHTSTATAQETPQMFKALKVLSATIVENSAVEREDLRPYRKSEKT